tara:strand:+ start:2373 stop:2558 length:186 start_codon:yes stop_codon:yes gene_type:complete
MNNQTKSSPIQSKNNGKIKNSWVYNPDTGEEQQSFLPLGELKKENENKQTDLFSYEEKDND